MSALSRSTSGPSCSPLTAIPTFRLPATGCLLLAAWLLAACASTPGPACRVAAIPLAPATTPDGLELAAGRVTTDCRLVSPASLRRRIPANVATLHEDERDSLTRDLAEGERLFYGEDVKEGTQLLLAAWKRLQEHPELLPHAPDERAAVYRALLAVLRTGGSQDPLSARETADWLALHMPDQVPSVRHLPPALAGLASEAARTTRSRTVTLAAPAPAECEGAGTLFVDGLPLGRLPVAGQPIPRGEHAVWFECDGRRSWVRRISFKEETTLIPPDLRREPFVLVSPSGVALHPDAPADGLAPLALPLAAWARSDAILFVPTEHQPDRPALLSTRNGLAEVPADAGRFRVPAPSVPPRTEPGRLKTAGWIVLPGAALMLAFGVGANLKYNAEIDSMTYGTADLRDGAAPWKHTAIGAYAAAGTAAAATALLFMLDAAAPPPPEPLF